LFSSLKVIGVNPALAGEEMNSRDYILPPRLQVEFLAQSQNWRNLIFVLLTLIVPGAMTACKAERPSRTVSIDGSSTVYPLSKAIAEAFGKANPAVQFKIAFSGTGGGFKKFCAGQLDIADASRPINSS